MKEILILKRKRAGLMTAPDLAVDQEATMKAEVALTKSPEAGQTMIQTQTMKKVVLTVMTVTHRVRKRRKEKAKKNLLSLLLWEFITTSCQS